MNPTSPQRRLLSESDQKIRELERLALAGDQEALGQVLRLKQRTREPFEANPLNLDQPKRVHNLKQEALKEFECFYCGIIPWDEEDALAMVKIRGKWWCPICVKFAPQGPQRD